MKTETRHQKRIRRHKKIRVKIKGSKDRPRFCVFKSSKHLYVQLIDDENNRVLISASDFEVNKQKKAQSGKKDIALELGKLIAEKAKKEKITRVVFDRGGFLFQGKIKALAQGAREEGLVF